MTEEGKEPEPVPAREEAADAFVATLSGLPMIIARGLLYLIVAMVVVGLLWAAVNRIDTVAVAPATVAPEGQMITVQARVEGLVASVVVQAGQSVRKNDILMRLSSQDILRRQLDYEQAQEEAKRVVFERDHRLPDQELLLKQEETLMKQRQAGLTALDAHYQTQEECVQQLLDLLQQTRKLAVERGLQEQQRLELDVQNADGMQQLWEREAKAHRALQADEIIPELRLLEVERSATAATYDYQKSRLQLAESRQTGQMTEKSYETQNLELRKRQAEIQEEKRKLVLERQAIETEWIRKRNDLQDSRLRLEQQVQALNQRVDAARWALGIKDGDDGAPGDDPSVILIKAPVDGLVARLYVQHAGTVLGRGQPVVDLVPAGTRLVAMLTILPKDVGHVKPGQTVKFRFDAFPAAECGIMTGTLEQVLPAAAAGAAYPAEGFPAQCSLARTFFRVDQQDVRLMPGMTAQAEIITGRKRVLSLLLRPFIDYAAHGGSTP